VPELRYRGEPYPSMISIASPGRCSPASVSPVVSLMSSVRVILASVSSSEENRLSERETTRVLWKASGKAEYSECFEEEVVL
jgi:hypothetical protein